MAEETRILVVDDEIVIRALLVDVLVEEGYSVETAGNAKAALDLLQAQNNFIILFTDIMMPEMNGIELIREARKICPAIIPIVMTGFATLETARAAVKEGAYDYVLKPFSISEIKVAVSNALERHRLANENARLLEITELFNISEAIASIHNERQLLRFVLSAAMERVGASRGSIMVTTQDGRALEVAVSVGIPEEDAKTVVEMGTGISGWVAQHARPLLIENIRQNPGIIEVSRRLRDPSFISVPLEHKHPSSLGERMPGVEMPRVLGVINVNEKKGGAQFSEGDLKILSIVANHAAAALENVRLLNDVQDAHLATLQSMALLLEAKDAYTHGHSERVRDYSVLTSQKMGLSQSQTEILRVAAALHDVGKIGVKDAILTKCGPPTPEEWAMIRRHPKLGYDVLSHVPHLTKEHLQVVRGHHERIDGSGYPDGLQGDQLSVVTQITVVADSYDAMASDRAYRPALTQDKIIEQIRRFAGSQFDPHVATVFLDLVERGALRP